MHGGGFAGTIQAYVPSDEAETYRSAIDAAFGEELVSGWLLDAPDWSIVVNRDGVFEASVKFVVIET